MVAEVMTTHALSQRRACGLIGITRRGFQRAPAEDRNHQLRQRLRELAEQRRRWGCPMLYLVLRREGWCANHKRVERLYREEGLSLRRRRRRKRLSHLRVVRERPVAANQTWAVDFIHDSLISGRRFRAFAVLDQWSRESLAIEVDVSLTGERVTRVLERLHTVRGLPSVIQADNGPELRGRLLDQWAYDHGVRLQSIEAGKDPERVHREFQCAVARKMPYENGTDHRSRNEPRCRQRLTYEWDTKRRRPSERSVREPAAWQGFMAAVSRGAPEGPSPAGGQ
jgi:putative transposase